MKVIKVNGEPFNADYLKTIKRAKAVKLFHKQDKETVEKAWDEVHGVSNKKSSTKKKEPSKKEGK